MKVFTVVARHVCLALCLCSTYAMAQGAPLPVVAVSKVISVEGEIARNYVGTVIPINEVDVIARVSGTLEKCLFKEGAIVKKGTLLYQLEDTTYRAAVDALKANLLKAEAAFKLAEIEYRRSETLLKKGVATQAEHDRVTCTYATAKATIDELKAQLLNAENNLSYTRVSAALEGMISRSSYSEGNFVNPGSGPLASIKQISPIYVRFALSQKVFQQSFGGLGGIKERAEVMLKLTDGTQYSEIANVTLVDNKINPTTDSITMWATFENKDMTLLPGAFVTVQVAPKAKRSACAVVPAALQMQQDGKYSVYVLDSENIVSERAVTIGSVTKDGLQIITDGLNPGETVIVDGQNKIQAGVKCSPVMR